MLTHSFYSSAMFVNEAVFSSDYKTQLVRNFVRD